MSTNQNNGWYPELVFLTVVFSNSTDLAVVIFKQCINRTYFITQPREKHIWN